jgi:hypothetical protein
VKTRAWLVLSLVTYSAAGAPAIAEAHDHRQPTVYLIADGDRQDPYVISSAWVRRTPDGCLILVGDGGPEYPPPLPVSPGRIAASIVLMKPEKPKALSIESTRMDPAMSEAAWHDVTYDLRRLRRGGRLVGWVASWEMTALLDSYIRADVVWRDQEGCRSDQDIFMKFRLRSSKLAG